MFGIVTTMSALEVVLEGSSGWKTIMQDPKYWGSAKIFALDDNSVKDSIAPIVQDFKYLSSAKVCALEDTPIKESVKFIQMRLQAKNLILDPEIKNFPSVSLLERYSSCVFLMDIDPASAAKIQEQYGVICQSVSQLDDSILTSVAPDHFELICNETRNGWRRVLEGLSAPRIPSNCLIINDRNIFTSDRILEEGGARYGLDNIKTLLDVLLPKTFNDNDDFPYHVLIIYQTDTDGNPKLKYLTDPDEIEKEREKENQRDKRRSEIFHKLSEIINGFKLRPYKVVFELIGLKRDNPFFNRTHNRRIYSNYYTISCDHQVAAFQGNKSRCSQSIEILKLFSKLDKKGSDQPLKGHDVFVNSLFKSIAEWRQMDCPNTYWVSKDGNFDLTIHHLENRLVSPIKRQ